MTLSLNVDVISVFKTLCHEFSLDSYTVGYCVRRIRAEGITFLTVTLPKLGKAVVSSLNLGYFDRSTLTCFAWKGRSLRVFRSLLKGIFDENSGLLLQTPDPVAIWGLRQITEYFYKLSLDFSESKLEEAESNYVKIENELSSPIDDSFAERVRRNVEGFYKFPSSFDSVLAANRPRYGPGTFSQTESERGSGPIWYLKKLCTDTIHSVLRRHKAFGGFFKPYPGSPYKQKIIPRDTNSVAEVLFVPKDSRGPRVISREPLYSLSLQMAYFDWFSRFLEQQTQGRINFQDQSVNRSLAEQGSLDGSYATFDLKDASERVRHSVVRRISRNIAVVRFFIKERTTHAVLPKRKDPVTGVIQKRITVRLKKLAGMGSGLTFATMAWLIHAAIATEISLCFGIPFSEASLLVYVYGDDVIVRTCYAQCVIRALDKIGMKLNLSKSFYNLHLGRLKGYFRESCGGDYFNGNNVAPVRLRLSNSGLSYDCPSIRDPREPSSSGKPTPRLSFSDSGTGCILLDRHAKELHKSGILDLAESYWSLLERSLGKLPNVGADSPALGRIRPSAMGFLRSSKPSQCGERVSPSACRETVKVWCPAPLFLEFEEDPYFRLGKTLGRNNDIPFEGVPHGEVTVPRKMRLRRKKVFVEDLFSQPNHVVTLRDTVTGKSTEMSFPFSIPSSKQFACNLFS